MPMRQRSKCHVERPSKGTPCNFPPLPYDSHTSEAFANLTQGPEESLTLYVQ